MTSVRQEWLLLGRVEREQSGEGSGVSVSPYFFKKERFWAHMAKYECVDLGGGYLDVAYVFLWNMSWLKDTFSIFRLELCTAGLSRLYWNFDVAENKSWWFLCCVHKRRLRQSTHKHTLAWCPHSAFLFRSILKNLSRIGKYLGNDRWQDLTGVCFPFTVYTLTCSGSNLILALSPPSWVESCRCIDKCLS